AEVASRIFATRISEFNVVTEDLERATDPAQTADTVKARLGDVIDRAIRREISNSDLASHPLAIWLETRLGLERPDNVKWRRARPRTLADAAASLAEDSGRPAEACARALRSLLLVAALRERDRIGRNGSDEPSFAFKLPQLISGAGVASATLEPPPARRVVLEGQKYHPDDETRLLYATYFCRKCGQEYHPVRYRSDLSGEFLLPRDIEDMPARREQADSDEGDGEEDAERERLGFLTPAEPVAGDAPLALRGDV